MKKKTDELFHNLKAGNNLEQYFAANEEELLQCTFGDYLYHLLDRKKITATQAAQRSLLSKSQVYNILNNKTNSSRAFVIQLSFGIRATLEQTQQMLRLSENQLLYPRVKRDAILIFALNNRLSPEDTHELLIKRGMEGLIK